MNITPRERKNYILDELNMLRKEMAGCYGNKQVAESIDREMWALVEELEAIEAAEEFDEEL